MTKKSPQSCTSTGSHHNCGDHNSNTTVASMNSCRSCERTCDPRSPSTGPPHKPQMVLGSRSSDNGYSSCGDGCESCSMPSSNDGSDIVCSDGVCTGLDGKLLILLSSRGRLYIFMLIAMKALRMSETLGTSQCWCFIRKHGRNLSWARTFDRQTS
jgi:hypothetical protein